MDEMRPFAGLLRATHIRNVSSWHTGIGTCNYSQSVRAEKGRWRPHSIGGKVHKTWMQIQQVSEVTNYHSINQSPMTTPLHAALYGENLAEYVMLLTHDIEISHGSNASCLWFRRPVVGAKIVGSHAVVHTIILPPVQCGCGNLGKRGAAIGAPHDSGPRGTKHEDARSPDPIPLCQAKPSQVCQSRSNQVKF